MRCTGLKVLLTSGCLAMSSLARAQVEPVQAEPDGAPQQIVLKPAPEPAPDQASGSYVTEAQGDVAYKPLIIQTAPQPGSGNYVTQAQSDVAYKTVARMPQTTPPPVYGNYWFESTSDAPYPQPDTAYATRGKFYVQSDAPYAPGYAGFRAGQTAAWLGVAVSPVPPVLAYQLRLKPGTGVIVDNVLPDSPADKAGLEQYDLIQKLDDQRISSPEQLTRLVASHKAGQDVTLTIIREGKRQTVDVTLTRPRSRPMTAYYPPGAKFPPPPMPRAPR